MKLTHKRLLEMFQYNEMTGIFVRRKTFHEKAIPVGSVAGWKNGNGYLRVLIDGHKYYMHRLAWFYVHKKMPKEIDHINRNRNDNRLSNLRECITSTNRMNTGPRGKRKYKGISFDKLTGCWRSHITFTGKSYRPRFANKVDALICYNYHAVYSQGDFAYLNNIDAIRYMHD